MNRLHPAMLFGMGSLILASSSWGQAVSVDATSLMKRLDAIEARLAAAENRRASSGAAAATSMPGATGYAAGLDLRIEEIETEASQLRGANDRATLAIERLAKRLDDFAKDMDMRMGDLEARVDDLAERTGPGPGAGPVETPTTPVPANVSTTKATHATTAIPAGMTASEHYNKAYAYLTATDYKNAQAWFEDFLKKHSKDALADNAYYWLGEVYLVQNNPAEAVVKFRDGIKAFPKGSKVTANLFKMGVALEQLKQPKLARAAWEKLLKDYPTAPEAARAKDKLIQLKG